jgi:hypothetical protein
LCEIFWRSWVVARRGFCREGERRGCVVSLRAIRFHFAIARELVYGALVGNSWLTHKQSVPNFRLASNY